jgi:hypothetical protein
MADVGRPDRCGTLRASEQTADEAVEQGDTDMSDNTKRSIGGLATVVACLLFALGCSSAAKSKLADAAKGPACSAISSVQDKLSNASLSTLPPDQLAQVQSTAAQATTAIDALGDTVPSDLSTKLDDAQKKLDDAVSDTKASAEERKANVQSAAEDYATQLDSVKSNLGC